MTDDELDALERVYDAATPGPWNVAALRAGLRHLNKNCDLEGYYVPESSEDDVVLPGGGDAGVIVALHNAFPALLREIRAGRALHDILARNNVALVGGHAAEADAPKVGTLIRLLAAARKGEP